MISVVSSIADLSQSAPRNIHMVEASTAKLTSMHFHAWEKGLKTGMCLGIPWDLGGCLADFLGNVGKCGKNLSRILCSF